MQSNTDNWWQSLEDDDPITLEPLADLPGPPFELFPTCQAFGSDLGKRRHLFDGQVLAEYIISQGRFENPYNRAPLTREDCVRLDEHCQRLAASRLGDVVHREVCVTAAYDLQQSMRLHKTDGSESANQLALSLRREAATALLHLFQFRRTTRQDRRISSRNRQRELRQPSTSAAEANLRGGWAPGEEPHPGLVIIDDNEDGDFDVDGAAASRRQERAEAGEAFPELTPLASEIAKLREAALQGKSDFLHVAEVMAEEAAKEEMQVRAQQRVRLAARRKELQEAEEDRLRLKREKEEALRREEEAAKKRAEREERERKKREEQAKEEWEAARAMQAVEAAVEAEQRRLAAAEEVKKRIEQRRVAVLEEERRAAEAVKEAEALAEAKKEKERERRKRQKERQQAKKREEREEEEKKQREEEARKAVEVAKANAAAKCAFCTAGPKTRHHHHHHHHHHPPPHHHPTICLRSRRWRKDRSRRSSSADPRAEHLGSSKLSILDPKLENVNPVESQTLDARARESRLCRLSIVCCAGILPGTGFERLGHSYCSTDCVKKHKARLGS